jgi:hypothetical protein
MGGGGEMAATTIGNTPRTAPARGSGVVAASPAMRSVGKARRARMKKKGTVKGENGTAAGGF